MYLSFALPEVKSLDRVRALFETLGAALIGRPISLKQTERRVEDDPNGANACFVATWTDGSLTWTESVLGGSGNPRDGYGYDIDLVLTLPSQTLRLRTGGWDPFPSSSMQIGMTPPSGRDWLLLRETLRRELGEEPDRCFEPSVVSEVLTALSTEGDELSALALARECLARAKPDAYSREAVVSWVAAHDFASGGARMQVKEAPAVLEGWLALERSGDSTLASAFARLCPFDLARWKAAGLPTAPWFAHPAWPFEREAAAEENWRTVHLRAECVRPALAANGSSALLGFAQWNEVYGEQLPGTDDSWRWRVSRRARYLEGTTLPVAHVTLEGTRREPQDWSLPWSELHTRPACETQRWNWIGGPETGDALLLVQRDLPQGGNPSPAGVAFTVVGSSEFRARAEAAVLKDSRLKWYPVPASLSLEPWKHPAQRFTDVRSALQAVLTPEVFARAEELLKCRCVQPASGYCAHRSELMEGSRAKVHDQGPAGRARCAVWDAAFEATGDRPDLEAVQRKLGWMHDHLLHAAEYVDDSESALSSNTSSSVLASPAIAGCSRTVPS